MDHRTELRTAVELARLGNARRTAEFLGVSQSTVSESIARLERAYGTRLFDRGRHGSRPTATGDVLIEAARRSLELLDNAEREVGLLENFERGSLSIAAHPCLVETHLVPAVAVVLHGSTSIQCRMQSDSPDGLLAGLRGRRLEFFVGLVPDGPSDDLELETIGMYRPVPFCRAGHPLAEVPAQGVKVLRDYPLVTTETPQWYVERYRAGMPSDPALEGELAERGRRVSVSQVATMLALIATTDALGLTPVESIRAGVERGEFIVLDVPADEQAILNPAPIVMVSMRERPLPPSAIAVMDAIRSLQATKPLG